MPTPDEFSVFSFDPKGHDQGTNGGEFGHYNPANNGPTVPGDTYPNIGDVVGEPDQFSQRTDGVATPEGRAAAAQGELDAFEELQKFLNGEGNSGFQTLGSRCGQNQYSGCGFLFAGRARIKNIA